MPELINKKNLFGVTGAEQLPGKGNPLLVISNHCFSAALLPNILSVKKRRPDLTIVANAGFTPYLNLLGFQAISVNSLEHKGERNLVRKLWADLIRKTGEITHGYETSLSGIDLIKEVVATLQRGNAVWLTPAGASEKSDSHTRWRKGLDFIIKQTIENGIDLNIAMILVNNHGRGIVTHQSSTFKLFNLFRYSDFQTVDTIEILKKLFWQKAANLS